MAATMATASDARFLQARWREPEDRHVSRASLNFHSGLDGHWFHQFFFHVRPHTSVEYAPRNCYKKVATCREVWNLVDFPYERGGQLTCKQRQNMAAEQGNSELSKCTRCFSYKKSSRFVGWNHVLWQTSEQFSSGKWLLFFVLTFYNFLSIV